MKLLSQLSEYVAVSFVALVLTTVARADSSPVVSQAVIEASVADVWDAMTTKEGMESWMVAHAEIDLKVGGAMRTHYDRNGQIGDAKTIENTILCFEPRRMLSIKVAKPPEGFPFAEAVKAMWTVIRFDELSPSQTRVTVVSLGFGDDAESQGMRRFFDGGNAFTLDKLRKKFAPPDGSDKDAESLRLLGSLARGEWIYENTRDDGTVFRTRSVMSLGPDGQSLTGRGWLGGSDGMFFHAATQVWREPASSGGGIRFQNVDQSGSIARGTIQFIEPNKIRWDWNSTNLAGVLTRYQVDMTLFEPDKYRFELFERTEQGELKERVNIVYSRVDDAPERFKKLRTPDSTGQ